MNMEKCKYLLFCGTLALWMAGGFQQVYAATEPSSQAIQQQSNKVTGKVSDATGPIISACGKRRARRGTRPWSASACGRRLT